MTLYVEGMSAFYLTIWESREGKFNENTSKVIGEMSASCLSWMSPATQANNHTPLSADLGVTKKESSLQVSSKGNYQTKHWNRGIAKWLNDWPGWA